MVWKYSDGECTCTYYILPRMFVGILLCVYVCVGGWVVGVNHLQCSPKYFVRFQTCLYLKEEHLLSFYYSCVLMAQCFCNRSGLLTKLTEVF